MKRITLLCFSAVVVKNSVAVQLTAARSSILSPRLEDIASLCDFPWSCGGIPCATVCDIGTDHGLLAAALCLRSKRKVIAVDIAAAPLERARSHFVAVGVTPMTYLSDGLQGVDEDVETAIIAGVGGRTCARIIHEAPSPPRRFIIQPTQQFIGHFHELRLALAANGYTIVQEVWRNTNLEQSLPGGKKGATAALAHRYLLTLCADRDKKAVPYSKSRRSIRRAPPELELLVGDRAVCINATPEARKVWIVHHRAWLEKLAKESAQYWGSDGATSSKSRYTSSTRIRRTHRWSTLLDFELSQIV